jgi:hypothetical protein
MTTLDDLPFHYQSAPTRNGAAGKPACGRHAWELRTDVARGGDGILNVPVVFTACARCGKVADPESRRRGRGNRNRGNRAELDVARSIPGGRKMGPLGLPWDVEVGDYARLQVKKLARRPSPAEIARLIRAIPDTGDRLRGFVWVEAAGQGKRGQRTIWFLAPEFAAWHGADFGPRDVALVTLPLATWVAEFVTWS